MATLPLAVTAEPTEGTAVRWLRLAAPAPGGAEQGKLVFRLGIRNTSTTRSVTITRIHVSFPGSRVSGRDMFRPDLVLKDGGVLTPGQSKWWSTGVVNAKDANGNVIASGYNAFYLPIPAPTEMHIAIYSRADFSEFTFRLGEYHCPETDDGYPLFLHQSDLPSAAMMSIEGRHWANGGGRGTQIYAYDVGVVRWVDDKWIATKPGEGTGPGAYYAFGLPIRSVAAGTVHQIVDGIDEGPNYGDGNEGGNRITIAHANGEQSYYAHLQKNSFKVAKNDTVRAGTVLGLLGFTGKTGAPHCHIEIHRQSDGALRPYAFRDAWIREAGADTPFDPDPSRNWVAIPKGRGIPDGQYHLWALSKRPAWFPPGWGEVFKFGMPEADYQRWFNRITYAGYRPEFVDVFEHGGDRFYNAIFRPQEVDWDAQHHMNFDEYQAAYVAHHDAGYRLHNVTSYPRGEHVNYAAIWLKRDGPPLRAYHGRTKAEHEAEIERNENDNYHPVNVSVAVVNGTLFYTALWAQFDVDGWRSKSDVLPAQYQQLWNEQVEDRQRHAAYISAWQLTPPQIPMLSVIFMKRTPGSGNAEGRHGMNRAQLQAEFNRRSPEGWLTRAIAGYSEAGQIAYAAIWRKP